MKLYHATTVTIVFILYNTTVKKNDYTLVYTFSACVFVDDIYDVVVTWNTKSNTEESIVEYGIGGLVLRAEGNSTRFVDGGGKRHSQYIHRVWLRDLTPDSKYGKIYNVSHAF